MDFSKLTRNQRVALGGTLLAAIGLFLPWRTVGTDTVASFDSGLLSWGGLLVVIAAGVVMVLKALDIAAVRVGKVEPHQFAFALAVIALVMLAVWWVVGDQIEFGLYVGLIAAVIVIYGTFGAMTEAGLAVPLPRDFWPRRDS